jgi:hypothetical protein
MFRTLSQTNVTYRGSAIGLGSAGRIAAGDRLPWLRQEDGTDNFAPLRSLAWHAQIHGEPGVETARACAEAGLALQRFPWSAAAAASGFARDAFYLIRPDGYVALAAPGAAGQTLRDYQRRWHFVFAGA